MHRTRPQRPAHPSPLRIGIIAAVCIALLGYGIATTRCNAQWRDERTLFTRLARLSPQSAKVWNHLGLLDLQDHHVADAEAAFRSALAASAATAETRAGSHTGLGIVAEARGDADGAAAAYEQAIVLWPHSGAAYANLGNLAYRRGDRGAAIAAYRQSVGMAPGNATTWQNLGAALAAEGQLPEAVEALRRAVALSPDDAELRTALQHVDAALRAGQ